MFWDTVVKGLFFSLSLLVLFLYTETWQIYVYVKTALILCIFLCHIKIVIVQILFSNWNHFIFFSGYGMEGKFNWFCARFPCRRLGFVPVPARLSEHHPEKPPSTELDVVSKCHQMSPKKKNGIEPGTWLFFLP